MRINGVFTIQHVVFWSGYQWNYPFLPKGPKMKRSSAKPWLFRGSLLGGRDESGAISQRSWGYWETMEEACTWLANFANSCGFHVVFMFRSGNVDLKREIQTIRVGYNCFPGYLALGVCVRPQMTRWPTDHLRLRHVTRTLRDLILEWAARPIMANHSAPIELIKGYPPNFRPPLRWLFSSLRP